PERFSPEHPAPEHLAEEELVLLYYNEPRIPDRARAHFADCAECRVAFQRLSRTLDLCAEWTLPEPEAEFERAVWARLAPTLEPQARNWWIPGPRAWAAAAVFAALIVAAFLAGRSSRHPEPPAMAGL